MITLEQEGQPMEVATETLSERRDQRKADVDRLGEIEAEVVEAVVEPRKTITKCEAEVTKAEAKLLEKRQALAVARMKEHSIRSGGTTESAGIEQGLKDGAVPGLREFIVEVSGLWGTERHKWRASDREQVASRISQINDIAARAEALYNEPDEEKAAAELERLKVEVAATPA